MAGVGIAARFDCLLHRVKCSQHIPLDVRKFGFQHIPTRMKNHVDIRGEFRLRLPNRPPHAPLDSIPVNRVPQHLAGR
jgi:hypothetical protein